MNTDSKIVIYQINKNLLQKNYSLFQKALSDIQKISTAMISLLTDRQNA